MKRLSGYGFGLLLASCLTGACGDSEGANAPSTEAPVDEEGQAGGESPAPNAAPETSAPESRTPETNALPTTIDGLVEHFAGTHGLWLNGISPTLEASGTASTQAVVEEMFQGISFDEGPVTDFSILEERRVRIDEDEFMALSVRTNQGPKIILMRYQPTGWWTRIYTGE